MREFKFRYFDTFDNRNEMVYFNFNQLLAGTVYPDMDKVMQYVGIKDVTGREIYEGDIINYGYVVTYVDDSDGANLGMEVGFYQQRDNFESWALLEVGALYKVLGNIYENSDLLNK